MKNKPGKWRLILNLSAPEEASMNYGIPKELCLLAYMSVADLVHQALADCKGAEMAKIDVSQAYRNMLTTWVYWAWQSILRWNPPVLASVSPTAVYCAW